MTCNMTTFREKNMTFCYDPFLGVVGVCNDSVFAFMVLCIQFTLIW